MAYPITYAADFTEDRSRLTTFFRWFMVLPHFFVLFAYGLVAIFTIVGAWFAVSFTGRYPEGLYAFNSGFLRYITRVYAYMYLATDAYPPFGTGEDPDYPVRVAIAPPKAEYSRLKAFFRLIVGIPVFVINYVMSLILGLVTIVSWFWIVITGKQNDGLQSALNLALSYTAKANAYFYLLTEDWPPFSDDTPAVGAPAAGGGATLTSPEAPTTTAPASPSSTLGSDIGLPDPPKRDGGGFTSGDPLG